MKSRIHRNLLLLLVLLGTARPSAGQRTSAYGFLDLETNARVAAMGGAGEADASDEVGQLFVNPALMSSGAHRDVMVSYVNLPADVNAGAVAAARELQGIGTLAVGIRYLNWGQAEAADREGTSTGSLGASEMAVSAGLSRSYGTRVTYGLTAHLMHVGFEGASGAALAADAGVAYHLPESGMLLSASIHSVGAVIDDLGASTDELPFDVRLGVSKRLAHSPFLLTMTAYGLSDLNDTPTGLGLPSRVLHFLRLGTEIRFSEAFRVRAGYDHRQHTAFKSDRSVDLAGLSVGFGLALSRVRVDYAFRSWSSLGSLHTFTLGTRL